MQYNNKEEVSNDFHMYFDVLADMLDKIEPPNIIKKKLFQNSYKWIKKLSQTNKSVRLVMKSAIHFLSRHMDLFQDLLYPDYNYWHSILRSLSLETTDCGSYGRDGLKKFYHIIGQILTNQNNEESKVILLVRYYINKIHKIFQFFIREEELL